MRRGPPNHYGPKGGPTICRRKRPKRITARLGDVTCPDCLERLRELAEGKG